MRTSEAAHIPWSQTLFMHPRPPVAQPPAAQARPSPHTPRRPVYGSGRSPDAASAASRHFAQRKRETSACDREVRRAVAVTFTPCGGIISQGNFSCPWAPPVSTPPYTWRITHAKWNLLRRIERGNTAARAAPRVAHALRKGHKIAIWCADKAEWYTAKVVDSAPQRGTQHTVKYDSDKGNHHTHELMPIAYQQPVGAHRRWAPAPPPYTPLCPECGGTTRGGTGASKDRLSYTCDVCGAKCTCRHPATLARADPSSPRITENADIRPTQTRQAGPSTASQVRGARKSPRLAARTPDAGGVDAPAAQMAAAGAQAPPAPPPRPPRYRRDTDQRPCVADAVLTYHNANGLGAPGAGKGYLRDVALATSDIHMLSETSWDEAQVKVLKETMRNGGHRLWANTAKTRSVAKSGTAILARSTIEPCKGDGELWSKPDGKALAVALTVQGQPIVLLAAHLPHTDLERVTFLREVADGVETAVAAHVLTPEGAPWNSALYLWAGDLNLTCHPTLDNETPRPAPAPEVVKALTRLNQVMGGAVDVYRTLHPKGRMYTHGTVAKGLIKPGSRRRLDAWWAQPTALKGPTGVVSARLLHKERAGFSFTHAHNRSDKYKQSDHDAVQIILRGALIPKPKPRTTLRLDTLRDPAVRAAMSRHLTQAGDPTTDTADGLWCDLLKIGVAHQREQAKARGALREETLKKIRRLQEKLRHMPQGGGFRKVASTLERYKAKFRHLTHKGRKRRDELEDYIEQMLAAGQGKQPKPWAPPQPITRVREPDTCRVHAKLCPTPQGRVQLTLTKVVTPGAVHTEQDAIASSVSAFWEGLLNDVHTPSAQAERDRTGVLARLSADTKTLPEAVTKGLQTANMVCVENVTDAIKSLARGSTPGVDDMGLEFFLEHIHEVAPLLSKLFADVLTRGSMTPSMCQAVLSPLYKGKGSKDDRAMYRPISVTTIPYRILAKCIAQKLSLAVPTLVGDPQVGHCPGRTYDENVRLVRQTIHDINKNRPEDGGIMLCLDNAKAFDRLQFAFLFEVLKAFKLPDDLISAVRTLYKDVQTRVKINGRLCAPFPNTSGVKQGCPLSGILYVLVQEVQLYMIRSDPGIKGIPIPGPDGELPTHATRLATEGDALTERGLVDDTMVALASRDSILPLLRVLDRFEAMSNHRMNISKTMMLLLGGERGFDLGADEPAARALRRRGLQRTYDITPGRDDRLPDKWHGVVLGNEAGTTKAWKDTVKAAGEIAESLQACPMPHGSKGRVALTNGKVMGKAYAPLRNTAPADQAAVDSCLRDLQGYADRLVFGRWWLTADAAAQPRHALGVGHLHVQKYMQAAWVQPLLSTMGRDLERRPFKHYYAKYAREAYPALGMGRELLSLNLGFGTLLAQPPQAMPGEARQAFRALGALPPLCYRAPDADDHAADPRCTPRGDIPHEQLLQMPLLHNPMLDATPAERRATPAEEQEMLRWATHGVTRVTHVLNAAETRVLTYQELCTHYPNLVGAGPTRDRVARMFKAITANLRRWEHTLAHGPQPGLRPGQFRHTQAGRLLRARQAAGPGDTTVPAWVCEVEPQTGAIRVTDEPATLPADAAHSEPCPTICVACSDAEVTDDEDLPVAGEEGVDTQLGRASSVYAAKAAAFRHVALGPRGAPPVPDPRLLQWTIPRTCKPARHICLAYSTAQHARETYLAQAWQEPRSFTDRYAALLHGLSDPERHTRLARLAEALMHPAIPEEERHHLYVTMHHGHMQGANKCRGKGDQHLCATCLQAGVSREDTAMHVAHECPVARAVWAAVAQAWQAATSESLDVGDPVLTVFGLRPKPPDNANGPAHAEHAAREPAWRLLHAVTLLKLHQARTRAHMAFHNQAGPQEPHRTRPKHILRAIRQRCTARLGYEHAKAIHSLRNEPKAGPRQGAWYSFHKQWISTGIASIAKGGRPRLHLFTEAPPAAPIAPGTVHVRVAATLTPARGKRQTASAWAIEAHDVGPGDTMTERLRASGAVATTATHHARRPEIVAKRHTWQVAMQVAAGRALHYAGQLVRRRGKRVTISLPSATTARDLQPTRPGDTRSNTSHRDIARNNSLKLQQLGTHVTIRVEEATTSQDKYKHLQREAEEAARAGHLEAQVRVRGHAATAIPLWDELRIWDPGD